MKLWIARNENGTLEIHQKKPSISKITGRPMWIDGGWGHLTGGEALNLPLDVASKIQDDFIAFCVSQLRRDLKEDIE